MRKLILLFAFLFIAALQLYAQRARPHLDTSLGFTRLLTDKNTLLRGVSLSWDGGDNTTHTSPAVMPTQSQLNALSTVYGLNTLHLYLEMDCPIADHAGIHQVGKNAAICDQLVNMTAQANLYLIITIGCGNNNGQIASMTWAQQFWNFYAPRYKDRTHVIYETHNEPAPYNPASWSTSDWDKQVTLYNTIRAAAPNTHIMTNSFMSFNSPAEALAGINYMKSKGVDYSNASVAFHGYETMASVENCVVQFMYNTENGMTPALYCSEFDPNTSNSGFNNMLNSHNVGWAQFVFLKASDRDLRTFKTTMDRNKVTWAPDYGSWPVVVPLSGVAISPASLSIPMYTAQQLTTTFSPTNATNKTVLYSSSNNAVATVSPLGKVKGVSVGSAIITATTQEGNYKATCAVTVTAALPRPYLGSPVNIPGTIEAENFDNGGEGRAYHDTGSNNDGGKYRTDEGVDIETCTEGGFNVGWTSPGEWMEYTVNVATAGSYKIDVRVASTGTSSLHIEFNGVNKTGLINTPNTGGWQTWSTVSVTGISLSAGVQVMRVYMDGGNFNLNKITISSSSTASASGMAAEVISDEDALKVYPNPVNGILKIEGIESFPARVQVLDAKGAGITRTITNSADVAEIDVTQLPRGLYMMTVKTRNTVKTKKIIRE
jgi:hypothetical protein